MIEHERPLVAHSSSECILYMALHPCACGDRRPVDVRIVRRADHVAAVYDGRCRSCARPRRFEFAIDRERGRDGSTTASRIIDAGQFLLAAEVEARSVPADLDDMDGGARDHARFAMQRAVFACEEALKFVPPGSDRVPRDALFSVEGVALYTDEPGRFRKTRIEALLAVYRDAAARLAALDDGS